MNKTYQPFPLCFCIPTSDQKLDGGEAWERGYHWCTYAYVRARLPLNFMVIKCMQTVYSTCKPSAPSPASGNKFASVFFIIVSNQGPRLPFGFVTVRWRASSQATLNNITHTSLTHEYLMHLQSVYESHP